MAWKRQSKRREGCRPFWARALLLAALALSVPHSLAQTPVSGFSSLGGANSKKPIDIESDRLEVDDKTHIAIFIGNVSATQGDNNLKAPRLEVTYENASQSNAPDKGAQAPKPAHPAKAPAQQNAAADPLSSGQIKFIHALGGKVVFTSVKDEQEATGDDGIYDVKGQLITMTGKEVILTQKKNKVKGKKLVIDLATGKATVFSDRVRAVFQQETGKDGKTVNPLADVKKKAESASQPAAPSKKAAPPEQPAPSFGWLPQSR
jgi:lipopolysaccharide export system protein LptA